MCALSIIIDREIDYKIFEERKCSGRNIINYNVGLAELKEEKRC